MTDLNELDQNAIRQEKIRRLSAKYAYEFTEQDKINIERMCERGATIPMIANLFYVAQSHLLDQCGQQIARGTAKNHAEFSNSIYERALVDPDLAKFYAKHHLGWRDADRVAASLERARERDEQKQQLNTIENQTRISRIERVVIDVNNVIEHNAN